MNDQEKRLFVAVPIPDEARAALAAAVGRVRASRLAWVKPESYHLTVKFLGSVAGGRVPDLLAALSRATTAIPAFALSLEGVGAFPSWNAARVVWAGVTGDLRAYGRLVGRVERLCEELGFAREGRDASPHLTLARRRDPGRDSSLRDAFSVMDTFFHGPFTVSVVHLMESRLLPGGAAYGILETFPLRGEL